VVQPRENTVASKLHRPRIGRAHRKCSLREKEREREREGRRDDGVRFIREKRAGHSANRTACVSDLSVVRSSNRGRFVAFAHANSRRRREGTSASVVDLLF